jgi:hypothetical protein
MMICIEYFFIIITLATALKLNNNNKKLCINCKWFIPNKDPNMKEYGLCKIYKNVLPDKNGERIIYDYAIHCRINENMCGESGYMFDPLNDDFVDDKIKNFQKQYDELNERFSVEIMEKSEIKEIEGEMIHLLQEIQNLRKQL